MNPIDMQATELPTTQTAPIDAHDFDAFVEENASIAYNVAFRMLRSEQDAMDAVEDAFLSAFRAYDSFKGQSRPSTWLYRIVVNACLMMLRKRKTRLRHASNVDYQTIAVVDTAADSNPPRAVENNELRDAIEQALAGLPTDLRTAVVLRDVEGLSAKEAARLLSVSVPALKARVHRGRVRLREVLAAYSPRAEQPSSHPRSTKSAMS